MMPSEGHAGVDLVARAGSLIQHRIQNPLQVIVAEAELLRGSLPPAEAGVAESLDAIRTAARRIADSVTHFDDWARDALESLQPATAAIPTADVVSEPALTGALVTELRLLSRQVRALGEGSSPEYLQPRLRRTARLADLWLRSSRTVGTASAATGEPRGAPASAVAVVPEPIRHGAGPASSQATPVAGDADPRMIALLDRLRRLEKERSTLTDSLRSAREQWHFGVHELRNAAQALTGWLDIVGDTPYAEAPWYRPLMQAAEAVLQRAEDALGQVSTQTPPQQVEVRPRTVDLDRLAHEALDRVRPLTQEKHLRTALVSSPPDRGVTVRADPERTLQILLNLLRNSIAATPAEGAILVCIRVEPGRGVLEVEDSGPGIPPELADRLAGDAGVPDAEGRSGVGLLLSRRLAERMGGSLEVGAPPRAGGARVILTLPRDE